MPITFRWGKPEMYVGINRKKDKERGSIRKENRNKVREIGPG